MHPRHFQREGHAIELTCDLRSMAFSDSTIDAIRYQKPQFSVINRFCSSKCIDLWSVQSNENPFKQIRHRNSICHFTCIYRWKDHLQYRTFYARLLHNPKIQSQLLMRCVVTALSFTHTPENICIAHLQIHKMPLVLMLLFIPCIEYLAEGKHFKTNDD